VSLRVRVEPPKAQPFECDLHDAEIIIGRAPSAGLVVADSSASRQHARLYQRDDHWWMEDLGTRNGTWLNERLVKTASILRPGDCIRIGDTVVRLMPPDDLYASHQDGSSDLHGNPSTAALLPADIEAIRQAGRLRTLNEIHRALATPISLSQLLDLILERCFEVLNPEEGVILLREKSGELRLAATRRRPGIAHEILISRRLIDEVAGKGTPTLIIDAPSDYRFQASESLMLSGVKSVVAAPLADADGTIGLIALSSRAIVRQFAPPDLDMLVSLASAAALRVRNVGLAEEAAARRVLEHELALAHEMQMAMLPKRLPERREVDLSASLEPARSVGGDLYDFVLDDDRLWFIVADVSGKGVAAALYMAVAKTLFRAIVQTRVEVAEIFTRMNRELCRDNDQLVFVTAVAGYLVLSSGKVVLSDSGHNPVVLLRRDGSRGAIPLAKGVALGVVEDAVYTQQSMSLDPGDLLVLYTDGATDARNPAGELFGAVRLDETIRSCAAQPAASVVNAVVGTISAFAAGAPPEDDLTVLAIRYQGR